MSDYIPSVSVIVPIYNVKKYLSKCLESILQQNSVEFEIVCVEDGSVDNSREILQTYAKKDSRIHVIYHNENRGLSIARNEGILLAKGKYIWFVDSDDSIVEGSLKKLYDCAELFNVDMLSFGMECLFEDDKLLEDYQTSKFRYNNEYREIYDGQEMMELLLRNGEFAYGCVPRYFFKRDFLLKENLFFKEKLLFEDNLYIPICYLKAKRIMCINKSYYRRLRREGSITTSESESVRARSLFICYKELWKTIADTHLSKSGEFAMGEILSDLCNFIKGITEKNKVNFEGNDLLEQHLWNLICGNVVQQRIRNRVEYFVEKEWKTKKNLYIYGAGKYAEEVIYELNRLDVFIEGIIVTKKKERVNILGHSINEFKEMKSKILDATIFVAVAGEIGKGIEKELRKIGVKAVFTIE